jgi:hypothetical protein
MRATRAWRRHRFRVRTFVLREFRAWVVLSELRHLSRAAERDIVSDLRLTPLRPVCPGCPLPHAASGRKGTRYLFFEKGVRYLLFEEEAGAANPLAVAECLATQGRDRGDPLCHPTKPAVWLEGMGIERSGAIRIGKHSAEPGPTRKRYLTPFSLSHSARRLGGVAIEGSIRFRIGFAS